MNLENLLSKPVTKAVSSNWHSLTSSIMVTLQRLAIARRVPVFSLRRTAGAIEGRTITTAISHPQSAFFSTATEGIG